MFVSGLFLVNFWVEFNKTLWEGTTVRADMAQSSNLIGRLQKTSID